MSLFNPEDVASATVTVSSDGAEVLFCSRDALNRALGEDEQLALSFYRASTLLVIERLKNTNQKISGEISKSVRMATRLKKYRQRVTLGKRRINSRVLGRRLSPI